MKKHKPLITYLIIVAILSGGFILSMKLQGQKGFYLAQFYMMAPAISAIITRLFFYKREFKDANLKFGKLKNWLKFWMISLGVTFLSMLLMTLLGSIKWDLSGNTFLELLSKQTDINNLPVGITPQTMLLIYFIGGLTIFNIFGIITGFGEEFGWRGFMFPQLYKIKPWIGFIIGGIIWFAWHIPLRFIFPETQIFTPSEQIINYIVIVIGSIASFAFLAYIYIKTESIFIASFSHIVLNNSARSFSYFLTVKDQLMANIGTVFTSVLVVAILYSIGEFKVFKNYFEKNS